MKDISLHILDIIENSVKAGAKQIALRFSWSGNMLSVMISDNGPGFPKSIKDDPSNPFKTTRTERKVGLGLSFLKEAAEESGGSFKVSEAAGGGVVVAADFNMNSIDAKPAGDISDLILTAIIAWPQTDFLVYAGKDGDEILSTVAIREEIEDGNLSRPELRTFILETLRKELSPLQDWAEATFRKV